MSTPTPDELAALRILADKKFKVTPSIILELIQKPFDMQSFYEHEGDDYPEEEESSDSINPQI